MMHMENGYPGVIILITAFILLIVGIAEPAVLYAESAGETADSPVNQPVQEGGEVITDPGVMDPEMKRWIFTPLPIVFYTTDTGIGGGGLLVAERGTNRTDIDPLFLQTALTYTQKKQVELSLIFNGDFMNGDYRLKGVGGFFNTPSVFFGVGSEADTEETYERLTAAGELVGLRRVYGQLYGGPAYQFDYAEYTEYDEAGAIVSYVPGDDMVRTSGLGAVAEWDCRSSMVYPRYGSYLELRGFRYGSFLGSDEDFSLIQADARAYHSIVPDVILAVQGLVSAGFGEVPLHKMTEYGGVMVLRGYPFSRFQDKSGWALQTDIRFPIFKFIGGAVFAAAGQVGEALVDFRQSGTALCAGAGLRIRPNPASDVRIRLDLGFSPESFGVYITLMEAF